MRRVGVVNGRLTTACVLARLRTRLGRGRGDPGGACGALATARRSWSSALGTQVGATPCASRASARSDPSSRSSNYFAIAKYGGASGALRPVVALNFFLNARFALRFQNLFAERRLNRLYDFPVRWSFSPSPLSPSVQALPSQSIALPSGRSYRAIREAKYGFEGEFIFFGCDD